MAPPETSILEKQDLVAELETLSTIKSLSAFAEEHQIDISRVADGLTGNEKKAAIRDACVAALTAEVPEPAAEPEPEPEVPAEPEATTGDADDANDEPTVGSPLSLFAKLEPEAIDSLNEIRDELSSKPSARASKPKREDELTASIYRIARLIVEQPKTFGLLSRWPMFNPVKTNGMLNAVHTKAFPVSILTLFGESTVGENNLAYAVGKFRELLPENGNNPRFLYDWLLGKDEGRRGAALHLYASLATFSGIRPVDLQRWINRAIDVGFFINPNPFAGDDSRFKPTIRATVWHVAEANLPSLAAKSDALPAEESAALAEQMNRFIDLFERGQILTQITTASGSYRYQMARPTKILQNAQFLLAD